MKKLIVLIGIVACSFAVKAQGQIEEGFDKMRQEMELHMQDMMQEFEKSFDIMEGSVIKIDTFFTESFGQIDENGQFTPNENMEGFMKEMEGLMKKHFSDLDLESLEDLGEPAIPGPDELDEKEGKSKKQSDKKKSKKTTRKTSSL